MATSRFTPPAPFQIQPMNFSPAGDIGTGFRQGFAGIADQIQKNRDYAAQLEQIRANQDLARENLAFRNDQATLGQRNWEAEHGLAVRNADLLAQKERWDEAHPTGTNPSQWEEIPDPNNPGKTILHARTGGYYDEEKRKTLAAAAARTPGTKLLPQPIQAELTQDGQDLGNLHRANTNFKPEYAGHTATGEWANTAGRLGLWGGDPESANWWQDYRANVASIKRNRLYGASLTDNERADFDANDINPAMDPAVIQRNLQRQQDILRIAATKKAGGLVAQGADPTGIEQYLGVHLDDLGFKTKRGEDNKISEITEFPAIEGMDLGVGGYSTAGTIAPDPNKFLGASQ